MGDGISQTFLLLATFDIALVAVAIANYAVSASYLGRETRLSRWRMDKRKQKLSKKIKELASANQFSEIEKELKDTKKSVFELRLDLFFLSWLGAVVLPLVSFCASICLAAIGMNLEGIVAQSEIQYWQQELLVYTSLTLAGGFSVLLLVIYEIDSAARRIPLPKIEVYFEKQDLSVKRKKNTVTQIFAWFKNVGEDLAEDLVVFLHFPPTFSIYDSVEYDKSKQFDVGTDFPNYIAVVYDRDVLHIDELDGSQISLKTPDEAGKYEIPVYVYERKSGLTKANLIVDITD